MHPLIKKLNDQVVVLTNQHSTSDFIRVNLKETLQDYILAAVYTHKTGQQMTFIGGTALRKLYHLPRFSEDLDFSCPKNPDLAALGQLIIRFFNTMAFKQVNFSVSQGHNVHRLTVKFPILKELGLSPNVSENLHVKIETTENVSLETISVPMTLANYPSVVVTYPLETLMAGKISACLTRVFQKGKTGISIKGRDYFDLIWYLEQQIIPNPTALRAFGVSPKTPDFLAALDAKVAQIKPRDLWLDLGDYMADGAAVKLWCDHFHELYQASSKYLRT